MITADLDRVLAVPGGSAGTWRPGPPGARPEAGTYATTVAFRLARGCGRSPARIASDAAGRLRGADWVARADVTGGGYLTVTVTGGALARLAVRVTQAGSGCARGESLRGVTVRALRDPGLAGARTWRQAREHVSGHLTGRLAAAAGATVTWVDDVERRARPAPAAEAGPRPVAEAIEFAGADAVTLALCRLAPGARAEVDLHAAATHHVRNPAYAVRYAHAHAAATARQAADLGLDRADAAGFQPCLLAHPRERALLGELSWLPEKVGGAARRGRPDALARYLEGLAAAYFACQESCPAVWPGIGAVSPPDTAVTAARLWLAAAVRTVCAAGLGLLGVRAPDRL